MKNETITIKAAALELGCGEKWIRAEISRGAIKARCVNSRVIHIDAAAFAEYVRSRSTTTATATSAASAV
jgi:hypothetical protein